MAKVPSEQETRKNLRGWAKKYGCLGEFDKLMKYWDTLLANAKTTHEYRILQVAAVKAVESFFGLPCEYLLNNMPAEDFVKERNDDKDIIIKK